MGQQHNRNTIQLLSLNQDWVVRAHPVLKLFKGGHRVKAGEWFLEVQRVLFDINKTFVVIESFLNRGTKDLYVGENLDKVEISNIEKLWVIGYSIDNAYLRIGSCLEKIAQMVRVYYEHPDHGGPLLISQRCGSCPPELMLEHNCSFGALVSALHKQGRNTVIDSALFTLEGSKSLSNIKKVRNDISHRINKNIFYPGLDPDINVKINGSTQETTFTFGKNSTTIKEYRMIIVEAYNEITRQLNVIGPIIFPGK